MKFENCTLENNTLIEQAIITPQGITVVGKKDSDNCDNSNNPSASRGSGSVGEPVEPQTPQTNKTKRPKVVTTTFQYRWLQTDANRIGLLYQALLRATVNGEQVGWIDKKTDHEDFAKLFSGEDTSIQVRWTGTKQHLKYLFKVLYAREYITIPNGGKQPYVIVQSHFVDKSRHIFTDWDKEQDPKEYKNAIEAMAEILNPDITIEDVLRIIRG